MNTNNLKQAVILCGGLGTRLKEVVKDIPKPMALIGKTPFLDYIVSHLKQNSFDKFLFLTGYESEIIENYFKIGSQSKSNDTGVMLNLFQHRIIEQPCGPETSSGRRKLICDFSIEETPLGTAGALFNAFDKLEDEFFLLNGDTFFDIDFNLFESFINSKGVKAAIALRATKDISRYGLVEINGEFFVEKFTEKTDLTDDIADGFINAGVYYFKKEILKPYFQNWQRNFLSIEKDIFPKMVEEKSLYALPLGGKFIDIGIPEDYKKAQEEIPQRIEQTPKPAIFVDRDGTIIKDAGYTFGTNLDFYEDTIEFVRKYYKKGFYIFVVTNQAGIAKGKFSEEDSQITNNTVCKKYLSEGIKIDDVIYCPYHIDGCIKKYTKKSIFRKPSPGMLLALGEKYKIDYKNSIMFGDREDIDKIKLPYVKFVRKEFCLNIDNR